MNKTFIALGVLFSMVLVPTVVVAQDEPLVEEGPSSSPMRVFGDLSLISTTLTPMHGGSPHGLGLLAGAGLSANRMFITGVQVEGQFAAGSGQMLTFFDASIFVGVHSPAIALSKNRKLSLGVNLGNSYAGGERARQQKVLAGSYAEPTLTIHGKEARDARGTALVLSYRTYLHPNDMKYAVLVSLRRFF